jgi:hypothetical protein
MTKLLLHLRPPLESTDDDFRGTPVDWAIHGSEHGWHRTAGDYAGAVEALLGAGAKLPEKIGGSEPVREVLRRHGLAEPG